MSDRTSDSPDLPDPSTDALWAKEADDRVEAYRTGEVRAVALAEALASYQVANKPL
ncbi:addiction module protein [Ramlibacter sp. 2FC]|uniref:addiction module protein n=1 Tax=Ramlibacter sp. 2FC TaxID=2502188 RepID=UPI001485769F|nr:addiction module protein [Ramlibacter sp. 2FC]